MSGPEGERNDGGNRLHLQGRNTLILMLSGASLCFLIAIIIIFYQVYVRFYQNRPRQVQRVRSRTLRTLRSSRAGGLSWAEEDGYFFTLAREGLCKQVLDALPVFVYNPENFKEGLRCAVCLCEFEEEERGRVLPICNHSFHLECIDMWFSSHSTCPICRASVEKQPDQALHDMSVTEEEESSHGPAHPRKGNVNQHGTDDDSNVVVEIGITIHDIPANRK